MKRHSYYTGPSLIHGKGVFAARRITRGELIGMYIGTPTERDGTHVLWVEEEDGSMGGVRGMNGLRFLNHCGRPNAGFDGDRLYALSAIRKDQEITIHYGEEWEGVP